MEIPLPDNGHWQKLKYGKAINVKELPNNFIGKNEVELTEKQSNTECTSLICNKKRAKNDMTLQLEIPKKLTNPDKLILSTKEYLRNLDNKKLINYNTSNNNVLNINVSNRNLNRALLIMDYFIKLVKSRGHEVKIEYGRSKVVIFTVEEEFALREKYDTEKFEKNSYNKTGLSGILVFKAKYSYHKIWEDSKSKRLEEKIPLIIAWFEESARDTKAHWDENAKRRKIEEERIKKEQEIKEQKDNEIKRFKILLDEADRWYKASIIREYIKQVKPNNSDNIDNFSDWINWAKSKADWYDPLINWEDPLLGPFKPKILQDLNM
jgi:hypothetical protein